MNHQLALLGSVLITSGASATALASESPARIVCLGAAVTESVVALGVSDRVVGVDATSVGIITGKEPKSLGFYKRITAEGVLSLRADLVLANAEAGFPQTFRQLKQAGVRVVRLPKVDSAASAIAHLEAVSLALGRVEHGKKLVNEIRQRLARLAAATEARAVSPKILFIYARGAGAMLVGGHTTTADAMIALVGGINVAAAVKGFKPLSPEFVLANPPDVLLLATHGYEALGEMSGLKSHPVLSRTPAVQKGAVIVRDARDLLSFGPRFAERASMLAAAVDGHRDTPLRKRQSK